MNVEPAGRPDGSRDDLVCKECGAPFGDFYGCGHDAGGEVRGTKTTPPAEPALVSDEEAARIEERIAAAKRGEPCGSCDGSGEINIRHDSPCFGAYEADPCPEHRRRDMAYSALLGAAPADLRRLLDDRAARVEEHPANWSDDLPSSGELVARCETDDPTEFDTNLYITTEAGEKFICDAQGLRDAFRAKVVKERDAALARAEAAEAEAAALREAHGWASNIVAAIDNGHPLQLAGSLENWRKADASVRSTKPKSP